MVLYSVLKLNNAIGFFLTDFFIRLYYQGAVFAKNSFLIP